MRRSTPVKIGDVWGEFLKSAPSIARKIAEAKVPDIWPAIAGMRAASYTASMNVVKGVLYVHMSSSVARNEIFMRRTELKDRINEALGIDVVNTIIVK